MMKMTYDVVIIGAGLAGFSAALAAIKNNKKVLVTARGLGNFYSASGYIDFLGYYPANSRKPLQNPKNSLKELIENNPNHPYSLIGEKAIKAAFSIFLQTSREMGLPYTGTLDENVLMPSAAGALVPTSLYPVTADKRVTEADELLVVGIREMADFYPAYAAHNLKKQLKASIKHTWVALELAINRELNSYDIALAMEKAEIRQRLVDQLKKAAVKGSLVAIPAVLGVKASQETIKNIEEELECRVLEFPTLPPSVMGYRLAENLKNYLELQGVDFIVGHPVSHVQYDGRICKEIGITTGSGRIKKIKANSFVLATGGVLSEGLLVYPGEIKETVFGLPVGMVQEAIPENFFNMDEFSISYSGVMTNEKLQPVKAGTQEVLYENIYVAGATLAGYDPFIEKSGNGVALASGYKAGLMAVTGRDINE